MAEQATSMWRGRSSWLGIAEAGHIGVNGKPGVTVVTSDELGLATLITGHNSTGLERSIKRLVGLDLPRKPSIVQSEAHGLVWSGPDRWLLLARKRAGFSVLLAPLSR